MRIIGILVALLLLGLICIGLSYQPDGRSAWISSVLLNVGSGIVTAVVLIFCYDLLLSRRQEKIRREREKRAVRNLKIIVRQHYRVLLDCFRSSFNGSAPLEFKDLNDFFSNSNYEETVANLNLYAPSPMNSDGSVPYFKYIANSFSQFSSQLHSIHGSLGEHLSQELYNAIDDLRNAEFISVCLSLEAICNLQIPGFGPVPSQLITGMKKQIGVYCSEFCRLIDVMERIEPQGLSEYRTEDWLNLIFPIGHAKLSINGMQPTSYLRG
jgi:hypothetical protein